MITRLAAVAAALVLSAAPAAHADPQGGVAFDATDVECSLFAPGLACVHFTAEAVAAYRLGNDGVLYEDVEVLCTAESPTAVRVQVDCTVNGHVLPGGSADGPVAVTGGFVDLEPSYELEVCYSATADYPIATFTTSTWCNDFHLPIGL